MYHSVLIMLKNKVFSCQLLHHCLQSSRQLATGTDCNWFQIALQNQRKWTSSISNFGIFDQNCLFYGATFLAPSIKFSKTVGFLFCSCISVFAVFPVVCFRTENEPFWTQNWTSSTKIDILGQKLFFSSYGISFSNVQFGWKWQKFNNFEKKLLFMEPSFLVPSIKFSKIVGFLFRPCISVFSVFPVVFFSSVEFFCLSLLGRWFLTEFRGRRLRTDKRKLKMIDAFTRVSYRGLRIIYS